MHNHRADHCLHHNEPRRHDHHDHRNLRRHWVQLDLQHNDHHRHSPAHPRVGQSTAPGVIERIDMTNPTSSVSNATAMAEAPLLGNTASPFTRTIAPLAEPERHCEPDGLRRHRPAVELRRRRGTPNITSVVNAGNGGTDIAPGGLISVYGTQLSPVNMATSEIPLPTALANSCLSVNGLPVPILFVSPDQVNAQMPFQAIGDVTLILRTPGGQSNNYNLVIQPNAPSVFLAWRLVPTPTFPRWSATTTTNW